MTLTLLFDQFGPRGPVPNLVSPDLYMGESLLLDCIRSCGLEYLLHYAPLSEADRYPRSLYVIGAYVIPSLWRGSWLGDSEPARLLRQKLGELAEDDGVHLVIDNSGEAIDNEQLPVLSW